MRSLIDHKHIRPRPLLTITEAANIFPKKIVALSETVDKSVAVVKKVVVCVYGRQLNF